MSDDITVVTSSQITDELVKQLNTQSESQTHDEQAMEGEVIEDARFTSPLSSSTVSATEISKEEERVLQTRISEGEWDKLDELVAYKSRTSEGQLMLRVNAMDNRVRQLEQKLPMLLNQHLHDAYVQVLKKIHALRKTKGALFYYFYKNEGQRDLPGT